MDIEKCHYRLLFHAPVRKDDLENVQNCAVDASLSEFRYADRVFEAFQARISHPLHLYQQKSHTLGLL